MVSKNSGSRTTRSASRKNATRPSKKPKKPVTIDLDPSAVKDQTKKAPATPDAKKSAPAKSGPDKQSQEKPAKGDSKVSTSKAAPIVASAKPETDKPAKSAERPVKNNTDTQKTPPKTPGSRSGTNNKGGAMSGKIAAGLVGGIIALTGSYALQQTGLGAGGASENARTDAEIIQLKQGLAGLEKNFAAAKPVDLALLSSRLDALEVKLAADNQNSTNDAIAAIRSEITKLADKLDVSTQTIDRVEKSISTGAAGENVALTTLNDRLKILEQRVGSIASKPSDSAATYNQLADNKRFYQLKLAKVRGNISDIDIGLKNLASTVTTLAGRLDTIETASAASTLDTKLSDNRRYTQRKLAAIRGNLSDVDTGMKNLAGAVATLAGRLDAIETASAAATLDTKLSDNRRYTQRKLAAVRGNLSDVDIGVKKLAATIAALSPRLDKIEATISTPQEDEQKVARAYAFTSLKSAIDSGGSFASVLSVVEGLIDDPQSIAPLKEFADAGVPTISQLQASFSGLSDQIVAAAKPKGERGTMGKLFSNVRALVKVKSTGSPEGASPQAVVSRIMQNLKDGNLAAALEEWGTLPGEAKAVSLEWSKKLAARQTANSLVEDLLKPFLTGLAGTGN